MQRVVCARLLLMAIALQGCGWPAYNLTIHIADRHGNLTRSAEAVTKARQLPWEAEYPVLILEEPPEGLMMENDTIAIVPGVAPRFAYIGKISSYHKYTSDGFLRLNNGFWHVEFHEQHSRARNRYCQVQGVLRLITFGIWNAVPFAYPCFAFYRHGSKKNLELHFQEIKRAASSLGANIVVIMKRISRTEKYYAGIGVMSGGVGMFMVTPISRRLSNAKVIGFALKVSQDTYERIRRTLAEKNAPKKILPADPVQSQDLPEKEAEPTPDDSESHPVPDSPPLEPYIPPGGIDV